MADDETTVDHAGGALRVSRSGTAATILIDAPARKNALSLAMWRAFPAIAAQLEEDQRVRVVVLRGAGRAFSAGADIGEFAEVYRDAASTAAYNAAVRAGQAALRNLARPTIALIEGVCIGGGCGLALACDLRFAAGDAIFAITPAKLGLAYSFADTAQLVERVGPARAKDILFSGRRLDAAEALSIGLVDRVHPAGELEAATAAYADGLATLSQTSIRAAKAMINAIGEPAEADTARFAALFADSFSGPDFVEGYGAFLAKRPPRFS